MSGSVEDFKAKGNNCMKNGDFKAAVESYKCGLVLDPKSAILNCNIAQAYLNLKEYVEAEKCAKTAIEKQEDYVKAYYRAAKGALGRHNVYDSMLYLATGVQKCVSQDLEELFFMARELSQEFENALRTFRDQEKAQKKDAATSDTAESTQQDFAASEKGKSTKKDEASSDTASSKPTSTETNSKIQQASSHNIKLTEAKLKESQKKQKEIEEQEKILGIEKRQVVEEVERGRKELEDLKNQEVAALELKERAKKKEEDKMERERREEEEKKELERKEHERKEQEKKDREERERERRELEKKIMDKKEQGIKLQQKHLQQEEERKRLEEMKLKTKKEPPVRHEIDVFCQEGSHAFFKGLNRKAADSFKKALEIVQPHPLPEILGYGDPMDIVVLQFSYSQALIVSDEYKDIVKAIELLESLEKKGLHSKFPAIFFLLGRAYMRLNRFKNAQLPFERGISFLNRGTSFSRYSWPGTNDVIELTDRECLMDSLEKELQISKLFHKPDAICFFNSCLDISQHIVPSRNIFFSDLDFIGFINVICQENCHIYFHLPCWKEYKEKLSDVEKLSEKDFLGKACLTPDCMNQTKEKRSVIVKVSIIGQDRELKSSCEFTPPPAQIVKKESETSDKTQKKKPRKKDNDRSENASKRTRQNSKSQVDVAPPAAPEKNMDGQQYKDVLSKLAAAREQNFGYDTEAPDPTKVRSTPLPRLGESEEFVYSYFLEIFKAEGFMSIHKLQGHWEANKEHLPPLKPALITHTDLVKFLLDTEGFAVVQDIIGVKSALPHISAMVESKAETPQPVEYGWKPSPTTLLEASKTLSFTSTRPSNAETILQESQSKEAEDTTHDTVTSKHTSISEDSNGTESSSCPSIITDNEDELECCASSKCEETSLDQIVGITVVDNSAKNKGIQNSELRDVDGLGLEHHPDDLGCPHVKEDSNNFKMEFVKTSSEAAFDSQPSVQTSDLKPAVVKQENFFNNNQSHTTLVEKLGISEPSANNQGENSVNQKPKPIENPQKNWKPRAKLLEWASDTFPGESKAKLWEALTFVRAQNNYTLSRLSFDVIAERVQEALSSTYGGNQF